MTMREIRASHITDTVARLCVEANRQLPQDVRSRICAAYADEPWPIAKEVLGRILETRTLPPNGRSRSVRILAWPAFLLSLGRRSILQAI